MCLAIPGKVLKIHDASQPVMGTVDFAGIHKDVCLEWLPEAQPGDYVIVHVGFAISKVDEQEALETLKMLKEMGEGQEQPD
jgi:hydrogenase expression/formation protein HypC